MEATICEGIRMGRRMGAGGDKHLVGAVDLEFELGAHDLLPVAGLCGGLHAESASGGAAGVERRDDGLGAGVEGAGVTGLLELCAHVSVVADDVGWRMK